MGVRLAALTGGLALVLKRRAVQGETAAALVGGVFGVRACEPAA